MKTKKPSHDFCVLLAGGSGTRFWPQSRVLEPKQFLSLNKKKSLFEQTLDRVSSIFPPANVIIVTSELYRHQIAQSLGSYNIGLENVIFEPVGKNTAPSVGAGARLISLRDARAKICVLPCDHDIENGARFSALIKKALASCKDELIIFGIPPCRPATGYGYIKVGKKTAEKDQALLKVHKYCEKPDLETAKAFLKDGSYFWNSGIFVGTCEVFLREIKICLPELYSKLLTMDESGEVGGFWQQMASISFDYAVLEKTSSLQMIEASDLGWSDLGTWQAWDELLLKDKEKNVFLGDVVNIGSRNSTVLGKGRLTALLGVENLIVVDTPDALLVAKKDRSEEVKKVVDMLKEKNRHEHYLHRTVQRPWGSYTVLDEGPDFKIKIIEVLPGRALSLQLHEKRSEHWVVVEGRAKVIQNDKCYFLESNESTFVPIACPHRLINPSQSVLKIIEVQTGSYLGEDDIVRL